MSYTITSAQYANQQGTSVIAQTVEQGSVAVSLDRPELWALLQAWIAGGGVVSAMAGPTPAEARAALDVAELAVNKVDALIQSDLNMTNADVTALVDSIFSTWTAAQRTFMKRLVRMVLATARRVLRNGP